MNDQITPMGHWARYRPDGMPMSATVGNQSCSWHLFWEDGNNTNLWRASDGNFSWPKDKIVEMVVQGW